MLNEYWSSGNQPQAPQFSQTPSNFNQPIYAGFWIRFLAYNIDVILVLAIMILLGFGIQILIPDSKAFIVNNKETILSLGVLVYFIVFMSLFGATPGKRLLKLKVLRNNFTKLSFSRVLLREFIGRIIASLILISYIAVGLTKRKRGLHDLIADTVVLRPSPPGKLEMPLIILLFFSPLIGLAIMLFLTIYRPSMVSNQTSEANIQSVSLTPSQESKGFGDFIKQLPSVKTEPGLRSEDYNARNVTSEFMYAALRYQAQKNTFPWINNPSSISLSSTEITESINKLIQDNDLKNNFVSINSNIFPDIFLTSTQNAISVCFQPKSQTLQSDPETKYNITGGLQNGCPSSNQSNTLCYYCLASNTLK
ncbi:RDD family protein [Candidatus Gottesmanbacteria bacterium]|nr:RDD family protein [Candidatus Gottesmanbacteria bacterium]